MNNPFRAPWTKGAQFDNVIIVKDVDGQPICTLAPAPHWDSLQNDHARLIEAAPDMHDACVKALQLIRDTWIHEHGHKQVGEAWHALEQALAKVTGP